MVLPGIGVPPGMNATTQSSACTRRCLLGPRQWPAIHPEWPHGLTIGGQFPTDVAMRKTYQLNLEGKNRDRLLESSKHDIRKYIRRERRKDLPEGADYWDFDMRFGADEASAAPLPPAELIRSINALTSEGGEQFFVEILRKPGKRTPRADGDNAPGGELDFEQD